MVKTECATWGKFAGKHPFFTFLQEARKLTRSTTPHDEHWPPIGTGLWTRWWGYLARWLIFGLVVHVFLPVPDSTEPWWQLKLMQAAVGLLFGLVCALVFTLTENSWNGPRVPWKSWTLVVGTWLLVKVVFVSAMAIAA